MAISSLFAKFKGLGPVIFVGGAVLVTIKLLTTQTPTTEESLIVKVEEDIKTDPYEDKIEIPPEPTPPEPEKEPQTEPKEEEVEDTAEDTEQDEEEEAEKEAGENDENAEEKEEEKKKDQQQPPPATKRKFIDTGVGALLGKILKPSKG